MFEALRLWCRGWHKQRETGDRCQVFWHAHPPGDAWPLQRDVLPSFHRWLPAIPSTDAPIIHSTSKSTYVPTYLPISDLQSLSLLLVLWQMDSEGSTKTTCFLLFIFFHITGFIHTDHEDPWRGGQAVDMLQLWFQHWVHRTRLDSRILNTKTLVCLGWSKIWPG